MRKHTPGPWSQGYIVDNNRLKHLPKEQLEVFETDEKLSVYANFSPMDNGRGRNLIARAYSVNDAARIVECVNACEGQEIETVKLATAHRNACMDWETTMMRLVGEDGTVSAKDAITKLHTDRDRLRSALQGLINAVNPLDRLRTLDHAEVEAINDANQLLVELAHEGGEHE